MSIKIDSRLIGKSIRALRLSRRLTQDQLADVVGYSVRNLRRIENDGTTSIDVVNLFAGVFNVSALDILNGCFLFIKIKKQAQVNRTPFSSQARFFFPLNIALTNLFMS